MKFADFLNEARTLTDLHDEIKQRWANKKLDGEIQREELKKKEREEAIKKHNETVERNKKNSRRLKIGDTIILRDGSPSHGKKFKIEEKDGSGKYFKITYKYLSKSVNVYFNSQGKDTYGDFIAKLVEE